jgi:protein TonB
VYVSFVVNREGQVEQVKILRGLSEGLDAAVIKAVKAMKRWSPGKQRGRAVPVIYTLPFNIQLR